MQLQQPLSDSICRCLYSAVKVNVLTLLLRPVLYMIPLIFYLEVIPKNENGERHLVIGSAIWNELID